MEHKRSIGDRGNSKPEGSNLMYTVFLGNGVIVTNPDEYPESNVESRDWNVCFEPASILSAVTGEVSALSILTEADGGTLGEHSSNSNLVTG